MKEQRDQVEEAVELFPAYAFGLKVPTGDVYLQDVRSDLPTEEICHQFEQFTRRLAKLPRQYELTNPLSIMPSGGLNLETFRISNIGRIASLEHRLLAPHKFVSMEIRSTTQTRKAFVPVKVIAFRDGSALCKARFQGFWLRIELNRASLEEVGLREGDGFEWVPNEDGTVRVGDIRCHPRIPDPGEYERAQRVFVQLGELMEQART